jgi:hypothetical protein
MKVPIAFAMVTLAMLISCPNSNASQAYVVIQGYDFVSDPPCDSTRTTDCVKKFVFRDETGNVVGEATAFIPATGNFVGTTLIRKPPQKLYGPQQISVTAVGVDATGAPSESVPSKATILFMPSSPKAVNQ